MHAPVMPRYCNHNVKEKVLFVLALVIKVQTIIAGCVKKEEAAFI